MSLQDKIPYWFYADNKTRWMDIQTLKQFIESGGGTPLPNATNGNKILYEVPLADVGKNQYTLASIAGKDFNLTLEGRPMKKGVEYEVLSAGGFKLLRSGDTFLEGQRYEIELFDLTGNGGGGGTASPLFIGAYPVQSNLLMDSTHLNLLLQFRGGNSRLKATLTAIEDTPENQLVCFESSISNTKEHEIATKNGQNIYMNGQSYKSIYIRPGEVVWLYRGAEGWYVINDFGRNYQEMGEVVPKYKAGPNELVLDGSLVSRADYPRLWEYVQTLGHSLVDDAAWQITSQTDSLGQFVENPYRGCFSDGTDGTNFRLPDLRNQFIRGLHIDGAERFHNYAGGRQDDQLKQHFHLTGTIPPGSNPQFNQGTQHTYNYWDATMKTDTGQVSTASVGGTETRPKNVGMLYVIKA